MRSGESITLPESLRLLRNQPVTSLNVNETEIREELPDQGQDLVWHIATLSPPHEQRRLLEPGNRRILEWKVPEVVQGLAQDRQGNPKLLCSGPLWAMEVSEEELANW